MRTYFVANLSLAPRRSKKEKDAFLKKHWYEIKVPDYFGGNASAGYTPVTKSQGMRDCTVDLRGRIVDLSIGDICEGKENMAFRKFKLEIQHVIGRSCLTGFAGFELTRDKQCSLVRKWHTKIQAYTDVKTSDGYTLRVFALAFTRKQFGHRTKTCYAKSRHVSAIRRNMIDNIRKSVAGKTIPTIVKTLIPDTISGEIKRQCEGIYPLQNVFIQKVKIVHRPKVNVPELIKAHGGMEKAKNNDLVIAQASSAPAAPAADAKKE